MIEHASKSPTRHIDPPASQAGSQRRDKVNQLVTSGRGDEASRRETAELTQPQVASEPLPARDSMANAESRRKTELTQPQVASKPLQARDNQANVSESPLSGFDGISPEDQSRKRNTDGFPVPDPKRQKPEVPWKTIEIGSKMRAKHPFLPEDVGSLILKSDKETPSHRQKSIEVNAKEPKLDRSPHICWQSQFHPIKAGLSMMKFLTGLKRIRSTLVRVRRRKSFNFGLVTGLRMVANVIYVGIGASMESLHSASISRN